MRPGQRAPRHRPPPRPGPRARGLHPGRRTGRQPRGGLRGPGRAGAPRGVGPARLGPGGGIPARARPGALRARRRARPRLPRLPPVPVAAPPHHRHGAQRALRRLRDRLRAPAGAVDDAQRGARAQALRPRGRLLALGRARPGREVRARLRVHPQRRRPGPLRARVRGPPRAAARRAGLRRRGDDPRLDGGVQPQEGHAGPHPGLRGRQRRGPGPAPHPGNRPALRGVPVAGGAQRRPARLRRRRRPPPAGRRPVRVGLALGGDAPGGAGGAQLRPAGPAVGDRAPPGGGRDPGGPGLRRVLRRRR